MRERDEYIALRSEREARGRIVAPSPTWVASAHTRSEARLEFWKAFEEGLATFDPPEEKGVYIAHGSLAESAFWRVTPSPSEIQESLDPDMVLVEYFFSGTAAHAIVVTRDRVHARRLFGTAAELRSLADSFACHLRAVAEDDRPSEWSPESWQRFATELYVRLIEPLEEALTSMKLLLVAPDPSIAAIPFGALRSRSGQLLVEKLAVSYLPAYTAYRASLAKRSHLYHRPRVLAIGSTSLHEAPREAVTVSRVFPDGAAWIGREASEARFYADSRPYNILHFATHGLLNRDAPITSALVLASGRGSKGAEDGYLSVAEIWTRLNLDRTQLVVLSACNSAVTMSDRSGGFLSGIADAFLGGGVPTIVGTLWTVDDSSTSEVLLGFYRRLPELGPAEALRQAQLELLRNRPTQVYSHPYFWAPFVVIGLARA